MFTALDHTVAYQRRGEMAHEVSSARTEGKGRSARRPLRERWSSWIVGAFRASPSGRAARAGSA